MHQVKLFPHWAGGKHGYLYDVEYEGEIIVHRSPDPGFDAARRLQARGLSGALQVLDGASGAVRFSLAIQKGAGLRTREDNHKFCFERFTTMPIRAMPKWKAKDGS